ncbi:MULTISPECIES: hypothetical protein [Cryobacterium]|uniref:hypothetical protein n=1 Tax=Cryobacterium TaxID=69578 RepID=UPI000CD3D584|nr:MULTISPECIES: hypothetical protein [Cryobacterium]POH68026.1 hypothetical protein C3B60_07530 [Cryobacterium zongtaii]TFC48032.1 hypothetical protein E3O57_03725 [Cryobacterium sp. TMN-39-2]
MRTAAARATRAGAILAAAALCLGVALAPAPGTSEANEAAAPWRVTEHAGAGLATDHDAIMAREIYPGHTLAELNYSPQEQEWALYQKPLGDAASVIETEFADDYAYCYFGESHTFTMGFAGDAPAGAIAVLDATGLPYTTIEGLGFSATEYQAAADAVTSQVVDALDEAGLRSTAGFTVGSDPTTQPRVIVVSIMGDNAASRQAGMAAVGAPTISAPFSVTVLEGDGMPTVVAF